MNDLINASFEFGAAIAILNNCRVAYRDKIVGSVSLLSCAFFTLWGAWNIYYYPSLGQSYSFYCGVLVLLANLLWVGMLCKYVWFEDIDNRVYTDEISGIEMLGAFLVSNHEDLFPNGENDIQSICIECANYFELTRSDSKSRSADNG